MPERRSNRRESAGMTTEGRYFSEKNKWEERWFEKGREKGNETTYPTEDLNALGRERGPLAERPPRKRKGTLWEKKKKGSLDGKEKDSLERGRKAKRDIENLIRASAVFVDLKDTVGKEATRKKDMIKETRTGFLED